MSWTLRYKGTEKPFADWGLGGLKRVRLSQGCDTVSFTDLECSVDAQARFTPEETVLIRKDGICWFSGRITKTPSFGAKGLETQRYECAGPWWYLENLVFQQAWSQIRSLKQPKQRTQVHKGRVILGQDLRGEPMPCAQQLREILNYAISCEAPFIIGNIDCDSPLPFDEAKDISCAEAIQRVLRWVPDAVVWFNYSTHKPTLNITRRGHMPETALKLSEDKLTQLKITPRHDLQVPAVVLKFEKTHRTSEQPWASLETDKYPPQATGKEFKALVLTLELDGASATTVRQGVTTSPILPQSADWWKAHIPGLEAIPSQSIKIENIQRETELPHELTEGAIASWMPCEALEDTIKADISYDTPHEAVLKRPFAVRLMATDSETHTYSKSHLNQAAEATPQGLAKSLYEAVNPLQYEGELVIEGEEVSDLRFLGTALCIQAANEAWADMRALIQEVKECVDTGKTLIRFGPPKHLGAADLIQLLRVNRRRKASRHAGARVQAKAHAHEQLEQGKHTRLENSGTGPGGYQKMIFTHKDNKEGRIVLDSETLNGRPVTVILREEYVCESGMLKRRFILASEPYIEAE